MALAAKISSTELNAQVAARFTDAYLEARLIYAPGTVYTPGVTVDSTFLGFEVAQGTGGYYRQSIKFEAGDILAYSDDGIPLTTKTTIFAQDGGATSIDFSHVALVWSDGVPTALGSVATALDQVGVDGAYTNVAQSSSSGSGLGLTVDITVTNSGAATTDYALAINTAGTGYAAGEVITITAADLIAAGVVGADAAGDLVFTISTESAGVPTALGAVTAAPGPANNGTHTNVLQSSTGGSGTALTVDIVVTNNGRATTDYALTINNAGTGHAASDVITITAADLIAANVCPTGATGNLTFPVSTIASQSNGGDVLSVAKTSNTVVLTAGNEAVFYWNLKQFGYYAV